MNKDSFVYVVAFTFVVAFIFVFIISLVDNATAERVKRNQEMISAKAFLNVAGKPIEDGEEALKSFTEIFGNVSGNSVNRAVIDGKEILVKQFSGQGLWGTVTGVLATDVHLQRIVGLDIISHAETPGLGGRIEEAWFKDQFRNEKIGSEGIKVRKGEGGVDEDPNNSIVDGITGASLTSASMEVIINNEIGKLREAK